MTDVLFPGAALTAAIAVIAGLMPAAGHAQPTSLLGADVELEQAGFEDYTQPVGRTGADGVLRITLSARAAAWRPWGADGPALRTHVLAADGNAPRTPAPLIRARVGTPVHVTVHNSFDERLILRGLRDRGTVEPGSPAAGVIGDSLMIEPGGTGEVMFTPTAPGTFVYFGRTLAPGASSMVPAALPTRPADRSLWGALIVDPAADATSSAAATSPAERIFMITHWADAALPASFLPATRFFINGRSWPHTERLEYEQGDTVHWRVLNMTGRPHPMHLHGAYFTLDARADQAREVVVPPAERRLAVTEVVDATQSMRITWIAHEPGNWLFHCHFMRHMSWLQTSPPDGPTAAAQHAHGDASDTEMLGGLVLGITVRPGADYTPPDDDMRRRLDLHITKRDGVFAADRAGYGFVLQQGAARPAADSVSFPGSGLVLTRGEPTRIVVHNRADVPLGVHWHGLELESWADGVPGWSGSPGAAIPAIPPGDSLAVRMTPPRAGTFMYHVHSEPGHQLAQGLYGSFLVLEPGQPHDNATDRLFLLGSLGAGEDAPAAINGVAAPATLPPLELRAGTAYRLRFMHISPDDNKRVSLLAGDATVDWQLIAKDGADLPPSLALTVPALIDIHVGETYDVVWTPQLAGEYTLRVRTTFDNGVGAFVRQAPPPHSADVRVVVR